MLDHKALDIQIRQTIYNLRPQAKGRIKIVYLLSCNYLSEVDGGGILIWIDDHTISPDLSYYHNQLLIKSKVQDIITEQFSGVAIDLSLDVKLTIPLATVINNSINKQG